MALNLDACRECRVKLFDSADPKYQDGVGEICNVRIKNMRVYKTDAQDASPLINLRTNVQDFLVEDFYRDGEKDVKPAASTVRFSDCQASQIILDGIEHDIDQKRILRLTQNEFSSLLINLSDFVI